MSLGDETKLGREQVLPLLDVNMAACRYLGRSNYKDLSADSALLKYPKARTLRGEKKEKEHQVSLYDVEPQKLDVGTSAVAWSEGLQWFGLMSWMTFTKPQVLF